MKKILAMILALCLLCGATAFATEITNTSTEKTAETKVIMTVGTAYTVTIPADVTIDLTTRKGTGTVTVEANPLIPNGQYLNVYLEKPTNTNGAANYLKTTTGYTAQIPYNIYLGDSTQNIFARKQLLSVAGGAAETSAVLNFVIDDATVIKYAGNYSDTLTFTVALEA